MTALIVLVSILVFFTFLNGVYLLSIYDHAKKINEKMSILMLFSGVPGRKSGKSSQNKNGKMGKWDLGDDFDLSNLDFPNSKGD